MALIDLASRKSAWRGIDYYKQNKVLSCKVNDDGTYDGVCAGSGSSNYQVHVDFEHPRKSTCDCPLANGKRIICKHIVAVSLYVNDTEAERFKAESVYTSEAEERRAKKYDKYMSYVRNLAMDELRETFVEFMIEMDEYRLKEKQGK